MTEAYAISIDQLRKERDAALARAEAAERGRNAALDDVVAWTRTWNSTAAELATAKARLAELEAAEKERNAALDYLHSLGRYYGRPRGANETLESWAARITKAINDNREPTEVSVTLREELAQLQAVHAKLKAEGLAAIERAKAAERQHVDAAARAEAAEKERDAAIIRLEEWQATARFAHEDHPVVALIRKERDALSAQLDAVTAERENLKARLVSAIASTESAGDQRADAAERKLAELRPQLDELRAKLAAAEHRAAMHERDADEASRAVATLETMFCAAIRAVARGAK